jgi:hypothetical protein
MNTIAKRKVEQIITSDIQQKTEVYKKKRKDELECLIERYEKQPSKEALAIQEKIKKNKNELERLEKELEAVGFQTSYGDNLALRSTTHYENGYGYGKSWKEYFIPELTQHSKETAETVKKFEALGRKYALKIWAGEASEEESLFEMFENELKGLLM